MINNKVCTFAKTLEHLKKMTLPLRQPATKGYVRPECDVFSLNYASVLCLSGDIDGLGKNSYDDDIWGA